MALVGRFTAFNGRIRRARRNIKPAWNACIVLNKSLQRRFVLKSGYL